MKASSASGLCARWMVRVLSAATPGVPGGGADRLLVEGVEVGLVLGVLGSLERAAVERLDVGELLHVAAIAGIDLPGRERPEHEGVVGVRAVREMDGAGLVSGHAWGSRRWRGSPARGRC